MTKPIIKIHNAETNEVIDREMNAAEFAQYKADEKEEIQRQADLAAKAEAKAELLARLGITAEEAKLLLS
jgi:hypothetical protein